MSRARLQDLAELTMAARTARESRMQAIADEEAVIRQKLATLAEHRAAAMTSARGDGFVLRSVGADVLWQGWLDRTERELQIELARVLARKEEARRHLQRAYGRAAAAADLLEDARRKAQEAAETRRATRDEAVMLLRSAAPERSR